MPTRFLTALPVYNEAAHVHSVLQQVCRFSENVLVVDDGSTDETPRLLESCQNVQVCRHPRNRGYGAALKTSFKFAIDHGYDCLVTIDCDGQHQPQRIPQFVDACRCVDVASGSRYLQEFPDDSPPPEDRRSINRRITDEINQRLGLNLTDAFCGFKAYRTSVLRRLVIRDDGYAMPLELWVQAASLGLRIVELPVPLVYLEEERSFGGALDDARTRLKHYRQVLKRSIDDAHVCLGTVRRLADDSSSRQPCGESAG